MRRACVWLYRNARDLEVDPLRIVCSGHSAGGHLTAMMLATDWTQIAADLPIRLLAGAVAVSGLFDLAPVAKAPFVRDDLKLDDALVRQLSPTLLPLHNEVPFLLAVGALETAEFHHQSQLIANHWPRACREAILDPARLQPLHGLRGAGDTGLAPLPSRMLDAPQATRRRLIRAAARSASDRPPQSAGRVRIERCDRSPRETSDPSQSAPLERRRRRPKIDSERLARPRRWRHS